MINKLVEKFIIYLFVCNLKRKAINMFTSAGLLIISIPLIYLSGYFIFLFLFEMGILCLTTSALCCDKKMRIG